MAAVGRGRGRGRGNVQSSIEKRPGDVISDKPKDQIQELSSLLSSISIEPDKLDLCRIKDTAEKAASSDQKLEQVMETIYKRCSADWKYSCTCAELCQQLVHIHCEGVKFRDVLLRTIQADFKNKDSLRREAPNKCLGCIAFLCQVFKRMRGTDGEPFLPLIGPVTESIEILFDNKANSEELLCASTQLLHIGGLINKFGDKNRLLKLRNVLRDKILDNCGSRESRILMVDVLECFASNWTLHVQK